jgi:hypothetical protein
VLRIIPRGAVSSAATLRSRARALASKLSSANGWSLSAVSPKTRTLLQARIRRAGSLSTKEHVLPGFRHSSYLQPLFAGGSRVLETGNGSSLVPYEVLKSPISPGELVRVPFTRRCLFLLPDTPPGLADSNGYQRSTHRRRPDDRFLILRNLISAHPTDHREHTTAGIS